MTDTSKPDTSKDEAQRDFVIRTTPPRGEPLLRTITARNEDEALDALALQRGAPDHRAWQACHPDWMVSIDLPDGEETTTEGSDT